MLAPMTVFSINAAKLQRPMARTRLFVSCGIVQILSQANDCANGVRIVAVVDQARLGLRPSDGQARSHCCTQPIYTQTRPGVTERCGDLSLAIGNLRNARDSCTGNISMEGIDSYFTANFSARQPITSAA